MTQNNSILKYLKHQPISVILIIVICVICMIPVPESQISNIRFFDKWTHLTMYAILVAVIMSESGYRNNVINKKRLLVGGLLAPIIMGGIVELAQAYLTCGMRSGDWLDFLANSVGALLGSIIGIPLARVLATRNKDD